MTGINREMSELLELLMNLHLFRKSKASAARRVKQDLLANEFKMSEALSNRLSPHKNPLNSNSKQHADDGARRSGMIRPMICA